MGTLNIGKCPFAKIKVAKLDNFILGMVPVILRTTSLGLRYY